MRMYMAMPLSREQRWAMVRLCSGFVQMFGAVFALTLILWTGVNVWSLSVVVATGLVTGTSLVLFRHRPPRVGHDTELPSPTRLPIEKGVERKAAVISTVR
jgi:hypothetical protein